MWILCCRAIGAWLSIRLPAGGPVGIGKSMLGAGWSSWAQAWGCSGASKFLLLAWESRGPAFQSVAQSR